ncbi:hypothetical protein INR49_016293 [Caranx melampygus]|nr:hypothetical protein INR49_016293 [Caranx melampygus]
MQIPPQPSFHTKTEFQRTTNHTSNQMTHQGAAPRTAQTFKHLEHTCFREQGARTQSKQPSATAR